MSGTGPTARICQWACATRYEDIPEDARAESLKILQDEIGAMIAGSTLDSCKPIVDMVRALGAGDCTVVGHAFRAPLLNAVLANGAIGHADEVDPTSIHGAGHFAATMVPTALTMGQYVAAPGKAFLRAFILGAEVAARMNTTIMANDEARPEFYYSAGAAFGAAVAAGLLLGLDADKMEHALGSTATGCMPLMSLHQEELHQTKALIYSGRPARAGVESALLARHDFHAPREILTTEDGFFHAFCGRREAGNDVIADLGTKYLMKDLLYKRYSAGGPNLAPLYAYFQLLGQHKFKSEDIVEIEVTGAKGRGVGITDHHPSIHTETVLSLAACYGEYTFRHAHDLSYCTNQRFTEFRKRTRVKIVPREGPTARAHRLEAVLTVRTRDGGEYKQKANYPLMTQAELDHKFRQLAALKLDNARVTELERKIKTVEQIDSVARLVDDLQMA